MDPERVKALLQSYERFQPDVDKARHILLADADEIFTFKSSTGKTAHFARLSYSDAVRLILAKMPKISEGQQPTPEEIAAIFDVACEALALTNLEQISAEQFKRIGKVFVDEASVFLWPKWGLAPEVADDLEFFRRIKRWAGAWHSLFR